MDAARTLIDPREAVGSLGAPGWRFVDCRASLVDPAEGHAAWRESHIPGSVHADLKTVLSGPTGPATGRHPLPDPLQFLQWCSAAGIGDDTMVVAYDADSGVFAARLWWLLRKKGHTRVAVLDGGFVAWRAARLPAESGEGGPVGPAAFTARPSRAFAVEADTLQRGLEADTLLLIDARARERFRGETEPFDAVAGHVPGAVNLPATENVDADGRFLSPAALRARFEEVVCERVPASVVHMCGSGVTACHNLLAMEHAGMHGSRLYPGSWSEWIRDPDRPVVKEV